MGRGRLATRLRTGADQAATLVAGRAGTLVDRYALMVRCWVGLSRCAAFAGVAAGGGVAVMAYRLWMVRVASAVSGAHPKRVN